MTRPQARKAQRPAAQSRHEARSEEACPEAEAIIAARAEALALREEWAREMALAARREPGAVPAFLPAGDEERQGITLPAVRFLAERH